MRSSVRFLLLAFFGLVFFSPLGCKSYRNNKDTYYLVANNLKLPYWKTVQDGFNNAAQEYGVTPIVVGPENYDANAESDALNEAVARRPAGILISAAAAGSLQHGISDAKAANIPVITIDSDGPDTERLFFIGTNNLEAGHVGGRRLVQQLHGKGNVVFFSIPGQPNIEERVKGYTQIFSDNPGIKVVDIVGTGGEYGSAFDRAEQYVQQQGPKKIDAFVCVSSECGKAVAEVLKRNHVTDRVVIAMDVDPDTLALIRDGVIDSTVSQRPYTMGYLGLKFLDDIHHSQKGAFRSSYTAVFRSPFPTFVDTGSALISKDNLFIYEHAFD